MLKQRRTELGNTCEIADIHLGAGRSRVLGRVVEGRVARFDEGPSHRLLDGMLIKRGPDAQDYAAKSFEK
jgi:hypothetical protein